MKTIDPAPARTRNVPAAALLLAAALAGLLGSCRSRSDKDLIAAVIGDMARSVESKDADALVAQLAEGYADFEGRDRDATRALAEEYFRRYRGIRTKMLSSRIAMGESGTATAEIDVSLYSGVGAALRKAVGFSGENYRVSCVFRKQETWRISGARWEYVPVESLFPESLKVLREIFPDL